MPALHGNRALNPASTPAWLLSPYNYAWFVGFILAFLIYPILRKLAPSA